ncbi:hypothetical protein KIN20_031889 [Parelaphostrongylus tenuis]|uniref:Uncharacterized protein n=1 Tax=Parelaphostrongylus tenuis TaxID=148309 RepID=A0AAD5WHL1_PARTN|nr:hypothetical protein KIN20_031889 [Parelaphostrongylus tenuis]
MRWKSDVENSLIPLHICNLAPVLSLIVEQLKASPVHLPIFLNVYKSGSEAGDSCEREIDATDPLRPSTNELSGAKLLLRRAIKEILVEVQPTVPGQVIRNHKIMKTSHGSRQGYNSEPRLGTATSQHTFVIETERRKPLVLPVGLTDGALEYKKFQDEQRKAKEIEENRLQRERAEREAVEAKERERQSQRQPRSSVRKSSAMRKEITNHNESRELSKAKQALIQKKSDPASSDVISCISATPTPIIDNPEICALLEDERQLDYMTVFGARPKLARTPDSVNNRGGFFH